MANMPFAKPVTRYVLLFVVLFVIIIICSWNVCEGGKMDVAFHWQQIDYAFPTQSARERAIQSGKFVPANNIPSGLEVWGKKVFVTLPRWRTGIVASLAYFYKNDSNKSPKLIPYPDWSSHVLTSNLTERSKPRIISPFRARTDSCDRLWVLDSGTSVGNRLSWSQIFVYDLHTDKLLRRYVFPESVHKSNSSFTNIVIEVDNKNCDQATAYIADLAAWGLIVYSWQTNQSYRIEHEFFKPDFNAVNYNVSGVQFSFSDGIFGLTLSLPDINAERTLYFQPFSSYKIFFVKTTPLKNFNNNAVNPSEFHELGSRIPNTQSPALVLDTQSGIFFNSLVNLNSVGCWNSKLNGNNYSKESQGIIATDPITMIYPNDLKVDTEGNLWAITNRMPIWRFATVDPADTNFRILNAPIMQLVENTVCQMHV